MSPLFLYHAWMLTNYKKDHPGFQAPGPMPLCSLQLLASNPLSSLKPFPFAPASLTYHPTHSGMFLYSIEHNSKWCLSLYFN